MFFDFIEQNFLDIMYQIFFQKHYFGRNWSQTKILLNKIFLTSCINIFKNIILEKTGHKPKFFYEIIDQNFLEILYQIFLKTLFWKKLVTIQ